MKIIFRKVEIHNFMSYGDEVFEFDKHRGLNLICGKNLDIPGSKNGVGKSTISNALVYGLYGQLPFKLKNENIFNRYLTDKNVRVCVYFDVGKKKYKVCSGLRSGKQSYCNLYEFDSKGNEKDITKSTMAETRGYMEKNILHCDLNLFMRTIVLNSDPNYNFYNLKHVDKKEFIDKLFDITVFGDMYNLIHRDVLRLEKEITAHQNQLIILNKNSDEYKQKIENFDTSKNSQIDNLTAELDKNRKELDKKTKSVVKRNTELISKCQLGIEKLENEISKLSKTIMGIDSTVGDLLGNTRRNRTSITDMQKLIDKHHDIKEKLCDDCKDIFSKHYYLDKYEEQIKKLKETILSDGEKIKEEETRKSELESTQKKYYDNKTKLAEKLKQLNSDYEKSQRELRNFELQVNSLATKLDNLKKAKNPYVELSNENSDKITEVNTKLSEIVDKYKYVKFSENIVNQDNLKKFIIKDLVVLLNNRIKYYLHKLGANYDIIFDEEMEYDFITQNKTGAEFHNFSSGEQARISISTCFAFRDFLSRRSNISSNILILDEFIDSNVDSLAIENTIEILKDFIKHEKQNIYLVSHRKEVDNNVFDNIIQVEKKDNISHIRYLSV